MKRYKYIPIGWFLMKIDSIERDEIFQKCHLTDREKDVINMRKGLEGYMPSPLEVVGKKYDVTRERISSIEEKAIRKMTKHVLINYFNVEEYRLCK